MTVTNPETLSAFERQVQEQRPPNRAITPAPRTVVIRPEEWSASWESRPAGPIVVGLRLLSGSDVTSAESEAKRAAADGGEDAYQATGLAFAVARGICDPNDVSQPHPSLEMAEDMVPVALSAQTIARLFDEIERLSVETVPLFAEASPEEMKELGHILALDEPLHGLSRGRASRVRRYLRFALQELTE